MNEYSAADNQPTSYRLQHEAPVLLADIALDDDLIDVGQHKDCMFYLQMRTAFNARTQPRDSLLGRMSEVRDGAHGTSSLAEKHFSFLREIDRKTQNILNLLTDTMPPNMCKKSYARYMRHLHVEIADALHEFSGWLNK